ncbi:hypothetical protein D9M69_559020 [compost metagenome]
MQHAQAIVAAVSEAAAVAGAGLFQTALAVEFALAEAPLVDAAAGQFEAAFAIEQAIAEFAAVVRAVGAVPFAPAVLQAPVELAAIPGAVVVVQPAFALQPAVHQLAAIARAIRQPRIRRDEGFAFATGGEQGDQGQGKQALEHGTVGAEEGLSSVAQKSPHFAGFFTAAVGRALRRSRGRAIRRCRRAWPGFRFPACSAT